MVITPTAAEEYTLAVERSDTPYRQEPPMSDTTESKCPFNHTSGRGRSNRDWWPNQLPLELLHQHSSKSNPMGEDFDYAKEFKSLDMAALKKDLAALMT